MATKRARKRTITAYVVQQVNWTYNDEYYDRYLDNTSLTTFLDRAKAEVRCQELEVEARRSNDWGLYSMGGWDLESHSSRSPQEIAERMAEVGCRRLPATDPGALFERLYEIEQSGTPEQKAVLWELMDRCRFYEVAEVEVELEE